MPILGRLSTIRDPLPAEIREVRSRLPRVVLLFSDDLATGERYGGSELGSGQSMLAKQVALPGRGKRLNEACAAESRGGANVDKCSLEPAVSLGSDFAQRQSGVVSPRFAAVLKRRSSEPRARSFSSRVPQIGRNSAGDCCLGKLNSLTTTPKRSIV